MTVSLDDGVDDLAGDVIGDAKEHAGEDDEAEDDARGLCDLLAVGPLDALQLCPARTQEAEDAIARGAMLGRLGVAEGGARRRHPAAFAPVVIGEPAGAGALSDCAGGSEPRHGELASFPVACVPPTPAAVLRQRDAIRVVALALVRLVVASLALLAREGDSDPYVSAGHEPSRVGNSLLTPGKE